MIPCRLSRLVSNHSLLPQTVFVGLCHEPPRVGEPFYLEDIGVPPTWINVRTTPIKAVQNDNPECMTFMTKNSAYRWERLSGLDVA
jgi:hypothetical protein